VTVQDAEDAAERRRWAVAALTALAVHAVPAAVAAVWLAGTPATPLPEAEPLMMIDLAPPASPPAPLSERPPGPQQAPAPPPRPVLEREAVRTPPVPNPEVVLPRAPARSVDRQVPRVETPPASATTAPASVPAPPAPAASSGVSDWRGQVLAAMNRVKRYPPSAEARRQQGAPWIRFVMDRGGRVLSVRLERSSGVAALDREAVALPRRAQPLPPPPAAIPGDAVELVAPVEFFLRRT